MPTETAEWIRAVTRSFGLWTVLWRVKERAAPELCDPADLSPALFDGQTDDAVHLFFGGGGLRDRPVWCERGGRKHIDFARSYAMHFVPPLVGPDHKTLLAGHFAIFPVSRYDSAEDGKRLANLYRRLRRTMVARSDPSRVVVQELPDGTRKTWKSILIGAAVPAGMVLKQFLTGAVVMGTQPAEPRNSDASDHG
jgi:hypothetical protein